MVIVLDFKSVEAKWQKAWFEGKAFEPLTDSSKEKYFFTVPYPYVSGSLHVGHGRTYAVGDVFARYKRMRGLNVLWPMAFHITGTPVLAICSKIAEGDEGTIKLYTDYVSVYESDPKRVAEIVKSFGKDPWNVVNYFSGKLVHDFKRMGFSLDLSRQFTTGDKEYNKFIEWQFHTYKGKGYLKQAAYPILYCVHDKNAVGEDDIKDGDSNPVEVQRFTGFKFKLEGDGAFIISATLRPDTVFGTTAMYAHPDVEYVRAAVGKETWIVSRAALRKLEAQGRNAEEKGVVKGEALVGKFVTTPTGAKVPVLPATFIKVDHATGFVHSEPADAPFDWVAREELRKDEKMKKRFPAFDFVKLIDSHPPIFTIQTPGYGQFPAKELVEKMKIANTRERPKLEKATQQLYKEQFYAGKLAASAGKFAGLPVVEAKDKIADFLKKEGKAFDFYEASREAECRCGGKVVVAVLNDQWFLDFNAPGWKEASGKCLREMSVYPEAYKKQFEDVFAWLDKRPCARRRGLGTQLPFNNEWIIESLSDSTIYMAFYTVIKKIRELKVKPDQLTREFFDFVFLGKGAGSPAGKEIRKEFLYWYPNDQRHTAVAHLTNHLSFFIFAHTGVFEERHWPKAITLNELVIAEGTKMSKSKGNVVSLNDIAENTGADLFRLYAISTSDLGATLDFRSKDIDSLRRRLNKLYAIWECFAAASGSKGAATDASPAGKQAATIGSKATTTASSVGTATTGQKTTASVVSKATFAAVSRPISAGKGKSKAKQLDSPAVRWMLSRFAGIVEKSTIAVDSLRLRDYAQSAFFEALNVTEHFLSRATEEEKAYVAAKVFRPWICLLTPVMPHACEEFWFQAGGEGFVSHAQWPSVEKAWRDETAEAEEDFLMAVVDDVRTILPLVKKKPSKITLVIASDAKRKQFAKLLLAETPDAVVGDGFVENFVRKRLYELKSKKDVDEPAVIAKGKAYLESVFGASFSVVHEDKTDNPRKDKALPGKPAIFVE